MIDDIPCPLDRGPDVKLAALERLQRERDEALAEVVRLRALLPPALLDATEVKSARSWEAAASAWEVLHDLNTPALLPDSVRLAIMEIAPPILSRCWRKLGLSGSS